LRLLTRCSAKKIRNILQLVEMELTAFGGPLLSL
jgi:hypothetical protein